MTYSAIATKRKTIGVNVGHIQVGGAAPIVVQSMTNTDTADVQGTARQCFELAKAGSELVRITVDREESAAAVPAIRAALDQMNCNVPLVGDFHYNGHTLLTAYPDCAEALAILCLRALEKGCADWPATKPSAADLKPFCSEKGPGSSGFQGFEKALALPAPALIFWPLDSLRWADEKR